VGDTDLHGIKGSM